MKKLLFLLSLILVFVVSCGDTAKSQKQKNDGNTADTTDSADTGEEAEQTDHGDTVEPEEQTDSGSDTAAEESQEKPDADGNSEGSDGNNEEPAAEKFCQYACKTASDCVQVSSNAVYDDDNYKCENGKCIYLGCLSDDECDEVYGAVTQATGKVYRCNKNGAYGYPECTPTCSNAADCNLYGEGSTQYAYDLDNNKCENGFCVYTGCLSDAECEATTYSDLYKCLPQEYSGKTLKICTVACQTAGDCPNSGLYECRDSVCVMKSCESDEWCRKYDENYSCF